MKIPRSYGRTWERGRPACTNREFARMFSAKKFLLRMRPRRRLTKYKIIFIFSVFSVFSVSSVVKQPAANFFIAMDFDLR